jgi:hypothetical protein
MQGLPMAMMPGVADAADAERERRFRTFGFANANVVDKKWHSMLCPIFTDITSTFKKGRTCSAPTLENNGFLQSFKRQRRKRRPLRVAMSMGKCKLF